jgi:hypothetical protein
MVKLSATLLIMTFIAFCFFVLGFALGLFVAYPAHETWAG